MRLTAALWVLCLPLLPVRAAPVQYTIQGETSCAQGELTTLCWSPAAGGTLPVSGTFDVARFAGHAGCTRCTASGAWQLILDAVETETCDRAAVPLSGSASLSGLFDLARPLADLSVQVRTVSFALSGHVYTLVDAGTHLFCTQYGCDDYGDRYLAMRAIVDQAAPAPTMAPSGGYFAAAQTVTLSAPPPADAIRYTLDGSLPTDASPSVAPGGTITVSGSATLTAVATAPGLYPSPAASAAFAISPRWPDALRALRLSAGLAAPEPGDAALNVVTDGPSAAVVDMADAVRLLRLAAAS